MDALFIAAVFPPLFVVFAWAVLTVISYSLPDRRVPATQHRIWLEQHREASSRPTLVGASEIRETQRRLSRRMVVQQRYSLSVSAASPVRRLRDDWMEDLWSRRN